MPAPSRKRESGVLGNARNKRYTSDFTGSGGVFPLFNSTTLSVVPVITKRKTPRVFRPLSKSEGLPVSRKVIMDPKEHAHAHMVRKPDENRGRTLKKLQRIIEDKYKVQFRDYWDFHKWSVENLAQFWGEMWDFCGIISSKKFDKVVDIKDSGVLQEWFPGAKLNLAENLLKYRNDRIAMIIAGEDREHENVTFNEMYEEAKLYASAFRKFGLKKGDVVAAYVSNRKEAVFTMQAAASIGAVMTSALPLLGPQAVLNRFQQVSPKVLLTIDRFKNDGHEIEMLSKVKVITEGVPTLEKVLIIPSTENSKSKDISFIKNSCFLDDFLRTGIEEDNTIPPLIFEQVSFSHPVFINYTSGTTGVPKALVHGCSTLLTIYRDFTLHFDSVPGNVWLTMSPPGWVTWVCFVLLHQAELTLVLFEGVPFYLSPTYFWNMLDEFQVTHIFIQPSILDELQRRDYIPQRQLKSLEVCLAGGTVVKSRNYDLIYEKVKKDVLFAACFGCTEFVGCGMIMESTLPVYKEEISALGLGVDIKVLNQKGNAVEGDLGELVVVKPTPNLPVCLWGDTDGSLYRKTYFSKYPGKFSLGDYGIINPVTRGIKICCRSDETLKQRGCRFGSSEIYNVVEKFTEVQDSLCVSQYNKIGDERAVLFLKMKEGHSFSDRLAASIREAITKDLTARHVPDIIVETADIPYNINGKKMEIMVKKIINTMPYNMDTIRNPESLKYFMNVPILQGF